MNHETDTPRTDAFVAQNSLLEFVEDKHELTIIHARQLERELDESKADLMRTQIEMQLEIDRAEAEVERLDHLLADASETNHRLQAKVERLKDERELYLAANADVRRIAEERNKAEAEKNA